MEMSLWGQNGVSHSGPHMETLTMNRKERDRITIMRGIKNQTLPQIQAAQLMGVGYRQAKRVWRRYQDAGDAGLGHRLRGRAGLRCQPPAVRVQVLARHAGMKRRQRDRFIPAQQHSIRLSHVRKSA